MYIHCSVSFFLLMHTHHYTQLACVLMLSKLCFPQSLDMLCKDVQTALSGSNLCSISNSPLYCTTLLKTACCQKDVAPDKASPSSRPHRRVSMEGFPLLSSSRGSGNGGRPRSVESGGGGGGGKGGEGGGGGGVGREIFGRSKPIPIQMQTSSPWRRHSLHSSNMFPHGGGSATTSYSPHLLHSWAVLSGVWGGGVGGSSVHTTGSLRSWVMVSEPSDSELSGYEADVERGSHSVELAESCGDMEEELEEGELLRSLTSYLVPPEVQQRVWLLPPIWHCIELLRENVSKGPSTHGSGCFLFVLCVCPSFHLYIHVSPSVKLFFLSICSPQYSLFFCLSSRFWKFLFYTHMCRMPASTCTSLYCPFIYLPFFSI